MYISHVILAPSLGCKMADEVPCSSGSKEYEKDSDLCVSQAPTTDTDQPLKDEDSASKVKPIKKRKMSKKKLKKTILKYEKRMKLLHEQIMKFQEADVSLEEMDDEDSVYVRSDYLMQRLVRTWEEWCHVTRNSPQIVVSTADASVYAGTDYEEINNKVQKLLEGDEFPDFQDVHELVAHCNTKQGLGLSGEKEQEVSRAVFKDVGSLMKKKRRQDFLNHFGCHLTDAVQLTNDPALGDQELSSTLAGIDSEAQVRMAQIMEEFVSKQNTRQQPSSSSSSEEEGDSRQVSEKQPPTADEVAEDSDSGGNSEESANEADEENPSDQVEEDTRTMNDEEAGLDVNGEVQVPSEHETVTDKGCHISNPSSPEFVEHTPGGLPPAGVPARGDPPNEDKRINLDNVLHLDRAEGSPFAKRRKLTSEDVIVLDDD